MNEQKDHFSKPKKLALYMEMEGCLEGYVHVGEVTYTNYDEQYKRLPEGEVREKCDPTSVRISEPMEVSFTASDNDQVVANAVAALNEAERKLIEEMNRKIAEIRGRKAQFLALSHQPESV